MCGIHEEVNTFATETMGLATVTGNMATGLERFEGQVLIDEYKGTSTWPGGWVDAFAELPKVEFVPVAFYNYTAGPAIQGEAYQEMKKAIGRIEVCYGPAGLKPTGMAKSIVPLPNQLKLGGSSDVGDLSF